MYSQTRKLQIGTKTVKPFSFHFCLFSNFHVDFSFVLLHILAVGLVHARVKLNYPSSTCAPQSYLTPWLGSTFLGHLDRLQAFGRLDALRSQHGALATPGTRHLGFPAARLAASLTRRSAHWRVGVHSWVLHVPVGQCTEVFGQQYCRSRNEEKKKRIRDLHKVKIYFALTSPIMFCFSESSSSPLG